MNLSPYQMKTSHFELTTIQKIGINNLFEYYEINQVVNFYLDLIIEHGKMMNTCITTGLNHLNT